MLKKPLNLFGTVVFASRQVLQIAFRLNSLRSPFHPALTAVMDSLLVQVRENVTIDVDSMDPSIAERYPAATFCDMTSNQAIVHLQASSAAGASILRDACDRTRDSGLSQEQQVSNALDLLVGVSRALISVCRHTLTPPAHVSRWCSWPSRCCHLSLDVFSSRPLLPLLTTRARRSPTRSVISNYLSPRAYQGTPAFIRPPQTLSQAPRPQIPRMYQDTHHTGGHHCMPAIGTKRYQHFSYHSL